MHKFIHYQWATRKCHNEESSQVCQLNIFFIQVVHDPAKYVPKKLNLRVILYLNSSEWEKQPLEFSLMYFEKAQKRDSDPTQKQVRCSLVVPRSKLHCTNKLNMCDLTNGKEDWQQQIGFYFCRIFWILWKLQALHWPSKIKNSAHTSKISTKLKHGAFIVVSNVLLEFCRINPFDILCLKLDL